MRRRLLLALAAAALAAEGRAAIDPGNFDRQVKPETDFYEYANGRWLLTHPIPPAYSSFGAFNEINDRNQNALHTILEDVAQADNPSPLQRLVGDFYASGMDLAGIEAAGIGPLQPELARLAAIRTPAEVEAAIARLHRINVNVGFGFGSEQDPKDSESVIAGVGQAGLGLPDRDYYFRPDDKSAKLRELYVAHVAAILRLGGDSPAAAQAESQAVMRLETALAKGSKTDVDLRDPVANYHKMPPSAVQALTPHFDWPAYLAAIGLQPSTESGLPRRSPVGGEDGPSSGEIDVGQPQFLQAFDALLAGTPVADWRAYLRWHYLHAAAPYLGDAFVQANFQFYVRTLTGAPELRERWKRVLSTVDGSIGEALGQLYVAEYFPPAAKARALRLVGNIRAALRTRLQQVEWMDAPTRAAAVAKLDAFHVKIGYPDKWRDYHTLRVDRGPYVLNVFRADEFEVRRDLAKIGRPADRTEWQMTPPTVNAYYDSSMNEIVFPAGILQPPFFDEKADDALNYGGIGAVMGHEMTHGFDDQGRQFDARGNLSDWWSPASAARFQKLAAGIVRQFNAYVAIDDLHVNGELTQGENIADLGGVKLAYAALQKALEGKPRTVIGGFTPEQRFFLSFASIWRENIRPEELRMQVNTDPHSPPRFRVNGPLSNLPEFARAFHVPEGAPMRRPDDERVVIW
jgi:predicted metalloendopeptidase